MLALSVTFFTKTSVRRDLASFLLHCCDLFPSDGFLPLLLNILLDVVDLSSVSLFCVAKLLLSDQG